MSPSCGVADSGEELLAQPVFARQQLDPAAAILEVEESGLAHQAAAQHATRQPVVHARRGTGLQIPVRRPHLGDLGAVGEAMGKVIEPAALAHAGTLMLTILSLSTPAGTLTSIVSPFLRPISARPTGDSFERRPADGSASAEPTMR